MDGTNLKLRYLKKEMTGNHWDVKDKYTEHLIALFMLGPGFGRTVMGASDKRDN